MAKKVENPFKYSIGTRVRDKPLLDMLNPSQGDRILDAGCGLGYFSDLLSACGANCIGVDVDGLCIDYCQRHLGGEYFVLDLIKTPYPFPDDYFDKVVCSEVIEHIKDNEVVLQEMRRILKPNGVLVLSVPCSEGVFGAFWKRIGHNSVESNSYEYHHHKGYSQSSMTELLAQNGFANKETRYTMVLLVEMFMGLSKVLIRALRLKKINSPANALEVEGMLLWRIYKRLFPLLMLCANWEQPLARVLKGHMIIVKGQAQ